LDKHLFNDFSEMEPLEFLINIAKRRKPGRALDVGMGTGRNAVWLASHGWHVTGIDCAEQRVAAALCNAITSGAHIRGVVAEDRHFEFGIEQWDLILYSYVTPRYPAIVTKALCPGGILIVEAGASWFTDENELPLLFSDLRIVQYDAMQNSCFGQQVVRFCGEKRTT
jgi:2-polyprenyl-3-methyl-5-hydroxy-6-metoxy-1,4-benzoquinol methylase